MFFFFSSPPESETGESIGMYGLTTSNTNRPKENNYGKNGFNSAFPTALALWMHDKNIPARYEYVEQDRFKTDNIDISTVLKGKDPASLFFSFESIYSPFQDYVGNGRLEGIDLVIQDHDGADLVPVEMKLTVMPDNTTANLPPEDWGCEIVIRPATTQYTALSIFAGLEDKKDDIIRKLNPICKNIIDWKDSEEVYPKVPQMCRALRSLLLENEDRQTPLIMETIWKTKGKVAALEEDCLDILFWSDYALALVLIDSSTHGHNDTARRAQRSVIRLTRALYDLATVGKIDVIEIYKHMAFNFQTDKEFAMNGRRWRQYVDLSGGRHTLEVKQEQLFEIISREALAQLSPERRFDQTLYFTMANEAEEDVEDE